MRAGLLAACAVLALGGCGGDPIRPASSPLQQAQRTHEYPSP
jgi:hypothetical protein